MAETGQNSSGLPSLAGSLDLKSAGVFLLIFLVVLRLLQGRQKNLPPGPWRWPLLGNVPELMWSGRHVHEVLAEWGRRYGSIMSVGMFLGRPPTIVISDIEVVKELLLKGEGRLDRSSLPMTGRLSTIHGSLIWSKGETARDHRKFGLNAFRKLGVGKKSLEHRISEEARYLVERIEGEKNRPFNPNVVIHNAVSNIICTVCFGQRFDYDDPKFQLLLRKLQDVFNGLNVSSLGNIFPFLCSVPMFYSKLRACFRFIEDFGNGMVKEHRDSYDPNDYRDLIDLYLGEIRERERRGAPVGVEKGSAFDDKYIWRSVEDMFAAGTDTTSNTILWLIAAVLNHPEVQDKLQREIQEVVGGDRQPSCEDRPNMPYTNAVLNEIQRWRSVAPFALPYEATQEIHLKCYTIPKGSMVNIQLYAMMNDPKVWDRPEEFNPDHFLSKDGKLIQHERFIPFSIGRRSCLGEGLARMELFLFVTNLFQRFTFKLPPGAPKPSMKGVQSFTFVTEPFEVCAVKR